MSGLNTARGVALTALEKWREDAAWSDAALSVAIERAGLDARDAALAARLCYGTLQNCALLDFYIAAFTEPAKLQPRVRDILRLSAYQLFLMDKIPPHAAVSEGVELCRAAGCARAVGLVNAVLRRLAAQREQPPQVPGKGTADYLATRYSHPLWLVREWVDAYGYDFAEAALRADNAAAPACLQVNTLQTTTPALCVRLAAEGIDARPHPWLPDALVAAGGNPAACAAFRDGLFYVQDAAARCAVLSAATQPGMRVLDACAAPGGKSFAAALQMRDHGRIRACDIHENKLARLNDGARRLGLTCIETAAMDARRPEAALRARYDVVLADVPCSGLGVIRKKPEIRYKDPAALAGLPTVQREILEGLALCVKPGGVLLYSTCTVRKSENEDVVAAFLAAHGDFAPEAFAVGGISAPAGQITLWPQLHGTDGFFICKLRKRV